MFIPCVYTHANYFLFEYFYKICIDDIKNIALAALLSNNSESSLIKLLTKQLNEYDEGRPSTTDGMAAANYGSGDLDKVQKDAYNAASIVANQIQSSVSKVPHSSDWKQEFRKVLGNMLRDHNNPSGSNNGSNNTSNNGSRIIGINGSGVSDGGTVNMAQVGNAVDEFANMLEGSLGGLLGGGGNGSESGGGSSNNGGVHKMDAHDRVVGRSGNNEASTFHRGDGTVDTDDAHTREALATFGRNLAGRLSSMDPRLLDSILLSTVANRRAHEISEEWHTGIHHGDDVPWWDIMKAESAKHALLTKVNESVTIDTQTTKVDFIKSGGAVSNEVDISGSNADRRKERRHTQIVNTSDLNVDEILGLSHLLSRHYVQSHTGSKKKKKRKLPKITTTIKTFSSMVGDMIQAKYAADLTDHLAGSRPQPFPDFLQQFFQLKFGKQHARAYQQSMKQLIKVASEVEHYYDKSPRVRMFARAAGILVCCQGGVCGCKCPDLLHTHIAAVKARKGTFIDEDGDGIDDRDIEVFVAAAPISKTNLSTGRGITRFRREMAELWVDLVAAAFLLPSTKKAAKRERLDSESNKKKGTTNSKEGVLKKMDPEKLANVLGDCSKGPVFVPASRLLKRMLQEMPWLKEPVNKHHKGRLDFLLMNLTPRRVDSLDKVHVCIDTACDALCDYWDRETER